MTLTSPDMAPSVPKPETPQTKEVTVTGGHWNPFTAEDIVQYGLIGVYGEPQTRTPIPDKPGAFTTRQRWFQIRPDNSVGIFTRSTIIHPDGSESDVSPDYLTGDNTHRTNARIEIDQETAAATLSFTETVIGSLLDIYPNLKEQTDNDPDFLKKIKVPTNLIENLDQSS